MIALCSVLLLIICLPSFSLSSLLFVLLLRLHFSFSFTFIYDLFYFQFYKWNIEDVRENLELLSKSKNNDEIDFEDSYDEEDTLETYQ